MHKSVQAIDEGEERSPRSEGDCLDPTHDNVPRHYSSDISTRFEWCIGEISGRIQKGSEYPNTNELRFNHKWEYYELWQFTPLRKARCHGGATCAAGLQMSFWLRNSDVIFSSTSPAVGIKLNNWLPLPRHCRWWLQPQAPPSLGEVPCILKRIPYGDTSNVKRFKT